MKKISTIILKFIEPLWLNGKRPYLLFILLICTGYGLFAAPGGPVKGGLPGKRLSTNKARVAGKYAVGIKDNDITAPPSLSYSGPQIYLSGSAIAPLTPAASGVASPGFSSVLGIIGSGFQTPRGIASDAAGNLYVADFDRNAIYKMPAGGGTPVAIGSGFTSPDGVAVDASGDVYVSDYGNNAIKKILAGSNTTVSVASFTQPYGIAVDATGNVYVADHNNGAIKKIPAAGGSITTVRSGFAGPIDVAVDNNNNLYVGDAGTGPIKEIPANLGATISLGSGFNNPYGVTVDALGNIFVADELNHAAKEIPAGNGPVITLNTNFGLPVNITTDPVGNVYIADFQNSKVYQVAPVGGYYLNTPLPAGLVLNNATGVISGTPTALTQPLNYLITAYNSFGPISALVNIQVRSTAPATIAYTSPPVLIAGTAMSSLIPSVSLVGSAGYGSTVTVASNISIPLGITVDANWNVYVAESGNGDIKKIPADGSSPVVVGTGFSQPDGVALDAAGNIYVSENGNNDVRKILINGSGVLTVGSGFNHPGGIAVDAGGNIYVADAGNNAIKMIPATGGSPVTVASGLNSPEGVAVDAAGNIYIADTNNNAIKKIAAGGGSPVSIGSGFSSPFDVAVDLAGNIFVADFASSTIKEIPAGSSTAVIIGSISAPRALAVDGAGVVCVADFISSAIKKIFPSGGYYLNKALPAGLSFNSTTAVISGTPTTVTAASQYKITAYNSGGGTTGAVNIEVRSVAPAVINYRTPWSFGLGVAVTPAFAPQGSGVSAPGYRTTPVTISTAFFSPVGLKMDVAGNIYVADQGSNLVRKIPAGGGSPVTIASGFSNIFDLALDPAGNIYVADGGIGSIMKVPASGGAPVVFASGFNTPTSVALDTSGNVYVVDAVSSQVKKIPAGGGTAVAIGSGFTHPFGVTVDISGNVYVADYGNNAIKEIPAGTSTTVTIATGLSGPSCLAVDLEGNIFVSDNGSGFVKEILAGQGTPFAIGSGFNPPQGIFADGAGNILVADRSNGAIKKIIPKGGYFLNTALPKGLNFDGTSGNISGTATVLSQATNYTITGYNSGGGTATVLNLKVVSSNADLSALAVNGAVLTPVFSSATTTYSAAVSSGTSSVTVTPTAADMTAAILVNSVATASGGTSAAIPLNSGNNVISVQLTAADGVTKKTYIVNVNRQTSTIATLASLTLSNGTLSPIFSPGTTSYHASVGNAINSMTIISTLTDTDATMTINGSAAASGTASQPIGLKVGIDSITVVVTAQDGVTQQTYLVSVNRAPSANANLANLTTSAGALSPAFTAANTSYTKFVAHGVATISFSPVIANPAESVFINGAEVPGGTTSAPISLAVGSNVITTVVTAQDGITKKAYTVTVTRAPSAVAGLTKLTLSSGTLSPAFAGGTTSYTASVPNATATLKITPTTSDSTATVTVNGAVVASGNTSASLSLSVGSNTFNIIVTAQDGTTTKTYTLTVTRAASAVTTLSALSISSGTLTPAFSSTTTAYTASVTNATASIKITPTTTSALATVTVNGAAVTSGSASASLSLVVGNNAITIVVTGQDGTSTKTYKVTVLRPSNNDNLSTLQLSSGVLSPSFAGATTTSYTATVATTVASITVTPTTAQTTSTVTVNGTPVTSGSPSGAITLNFGTNTVAVVVTAQDGVTQKTYTVTITRAGSNNDNLSALKLSSGVLSPSFAGATTTSYTTSVANTVASITVTPTTAQTTSTVTVNGTPVTSGSPSGAVTLNVGTNTITAVVTAQDGVTQKTYTVTVTRAGSNNDNLSALKLSSGTLSPAFAGATTTAYTASVANSITSVTVTPTTAQANATLTVNGTAVPSGTASGAIALNAGNNIISIAVTAQDGVSMQTYTVTVTRAGSNNANLSSLKLSNGAVLSPSFAGATITSYTASVASGVSSITVTSTTAQTTSTVAVNGTAVTSGSASGAIALNAGSNVINAVVTAQDGVTTKTYTVTVTRAAGPANIPLESVSVEKTVESLQLTNDDVTVHRALSVNGDGMNDFLKIDGIANYPDNRLMIMNRNGTLVYQAKGYDNAVVVFDGHSNKTGKMQLPGTYFYSLDYTTKGVAKHKTGFIVLKY